MKRWAIAVVFLVSTAMVGGCERFSFYSQAFSGQVEILVKRESIEAVINDPARSTSLRDRLRYLDEAREFAGDVLKLPKNGSYTSYTDLEREYVVWNVIAAPRYDVTPHQSCFPIAGCVTYRGFFKKAAAQQYADKLKARGLDVIVNGVSAYSTLGWFADPILNTMLKHRGEVELVGLLFHELAHQVLYKKGDTTFNESFATVVEREGLREWMTARGDTERWRVVQAQRARYDMVVQLILAHRTEMGQAYQQIKSSGVADEARAAQLAAAKEAGFAALRADYARLQAADGGTPGFDRWFARPLNHASLALFADYHGRVAEFTQTLVEESEGDWAAFYDRMQERAEQEAGRAADQ